MNYSLLGVSFDGYCWLQKIEIPKNYSGIKLGKGVALDRGVILLCTKIPEINGEYLINIGEGSYINRNTFIDASDNITIGNNVAIGPNCYITDHDHGIDFNTPPLELPLVSKPTIIGNNVWVGANSIILKGVTIGDHVVIGAGSVVTKSVPSKSIVKGVAAK